VGCGKQESAHPAAVPVEVAVAERHAVPYALAAAGTVEPLERVNVEAQVSGQLLRIAFREGSRVEKGQVLFEIDPSPLRASLEQAQAILARDLAQAENAARDAERYAALVQGEYVAAEQYEAIQANAVALQATVRADSAAVATARLRLQYATIRAPIGGLAGRLLIREGNLVTGPGTTLVTINQIRPILVRFTVPAQHLSEIRRHPMRQVEIEARPPGGDPEHGHLVFIDNAVDTSTGTVLLKGGFENLRDALWPGQFVSVSMQLYLQRDALVIPTVALLRGQRGTSVFVVDSALTATPRPVKVARAAGDLSVIEEGLAPGDRVVTDGQLRLVPGSRVTIMTREAAPPVGAP